MPHQAIIDGFKGTIDFYVWMGIPVARKWPVSTGKNRTPAVKAQWPLFAYASREWLNLSDTMRRAYEVMSSDTGLAGRDMQIRGYLKGLYRYQLP